MAKYDWYTFRNYVAFLAGEMHPHHDSELISWYHDAFLPWDHYLNNIVLFFHDSPITRSHFMDPTDRAIRGFYCKWSWSMNLTMKIYGQGHVWSKVKVTFYLQNSKVKIMVKVKPIGHIWGPEFKQYVCFSFRGNRTNFGWDIGNSIFDLENSRSRSWPRSNPMVTSEP